MSKIKNGGLDQYGAEPFEQQQFGTAGVEGVNVCNLRYLESVVMAGMSSRVHCIERLLLLMYLLFCTVHGRLASLVTPWQFRQ